MGLKREVKLLDKNLQRYVDEIIIGEGQALSDV